MTKEEAEKIGSKLLDEYQDKTINIERYDGKEYRVNIYHMAERIGFYSIANIKVLADSVGRFNKIPPTIKISSHVGNDNKSYIIIEIY